MDGAHNGQSAEAEPYRLNRSKQQKCNGFNIRAMFAFTGNTVFYIPIRTILVSGLLWLNSTNERERSAKIGELFNCI